MKLIKRDAGRASERLCNREIKFLYIFFKTTQYIVTQRSTFQLRLSRGTFGFGLIEETLSPNNNRSDNKITMPNVRSFVARSLSLSL